ncbi:hypothetical protein [Nocardia pseudovaccinii]|uniref:hypothetical protein n=1 Tax=Nocardia pseudovaccinii TaxID=189540 RepID=UPI0007A427F4|nr:hypothetical protein [Nocardia pseudovaccinii]
MSEIAEAVRIPELSATRRIPGPTGKKEPLKINVYERMAKAAAQLMPLFPYEDAGSIVPCGAVMWGGPDKDHGHFFHANTVSEVAVTFGSHEAMLESGSVMATQKYHGVNSFLRDEKNPDAFVLVTVTQLQSTEAGQEEAMVAKCQKCKKEIVRHAYSAAPEGAPDFDPEQFGGREDDVVRQFSTMVGSAEFAEIRNSDAGRTCQNCGHVSTPHNTAAWRWANMVSQTRVVNSAHRALTDAAKEAKL